MLCRHDKLFCAWILFPAHLLAKLRFFKGNNTVGSGSHCVLVFVEWVVGLFALSLLYALLPLLPDLVVLLSFVLLKASLGFQGLSCLSCKPECVTVLLNKEKLWVFFPLLLCHVLETVTGSCFATAMDMLGRFVNQNVDFTFSDEVFQLCSGS